jgi:sigma-E processing peptidase SpoIIGA
MSINALILYLTLVTLKEKISVKRILLSALIGTALAFFLPFIHHFVFVYKASAAFLMLLVLKNKSLKGYLLRLIVFVGYSFFLGGMITGLLNMKTDTISGAAVYGSDILPIIFLGSAGFFLLIRKLYLVRKEARKKTFYYRTRLVMGGYSEELTGYYDSGNKLYDTRDNTPVAILCPDIAEKLMQSEKPDIFALEINTVAGTNSLKAFKTDKFLIYSEKGVNIIENMTIAVADRSFKNFSVLLHNEMI